MPRAQRTNGATMTQNVGLKGLDDQNVFRDDEDREKFLEAMELAMELPTVDVEVPVWALMDNHVHMLMHGDKADIARFFQSLGARYMYYFNQKYEHKGTIWRGRYYARPIETKKEYEQVAAYIFNNPVAAGLAKKPEEAKWTNFKKVKSGADARSWEAIDKLAGAENVIEFTQTYSRVKLERQVEMGFEPFAKERVFDSEAQREIEKIVKKKDLNNITDLKKKKQRKVLKRLIDLGASYRQIKRLTGLTSSMIECLWS